MPFESPSRLLLQKNKIDDILNNVQVPPSTIDLELSWSCNQKCGWCAYHNHHTKKHMSMSTIEKVIDFVVKNKVDWIILSGGGEPTVHPDIKNILKKLENNKIKYVLYTNGMKLVELAPYFNDYCKYIRVSLDSATAKTYSILHGVSENIYEKILLGIKKVNITNRYMGLSYVISEKNIHEVEDFIKLAQNFDIDELLFRRNIYEPLLEINTISNLINSYKKNSLKMNIINRIILENNKNNFKKCYACDLKMIISADDKVPVCCLLRNEFFLIDSVENKNISDVWFSKKRKNIISSINYKKCPPCRFSLSNEIVEKFIINNSFIGLV